MEAEKLSGYIGWWTFLKDRFRSHISSEESNDFRSRFSNKLEDLRERSRQRMNQLNQIYYSEPKDADFDHIYKTKTRRELMRISAAVMGIEFSYAAETAFVSPLLLNIGVKHRHMTLIWCLSPLFGLFLTPILGSLSDGCRSRFGRRRPFILLLSIGIVLGLLLVPNGKTIGVWLGDYPVQSEEETEFYSNGTETTLLGFDLNETIEEARPTPQLEEIKLNLKEESLSDQNSLSHHPLGLVFTILGLLLLDFCADSCQSPSRAFMLDITIPEDHARGLSTFTIMAGAGGSLGYLLGAFNWEGTFVGELFGGQVRAVFTFVLFIFIGCVITTLKSFKEIPIDRIWAANNRAKFNQVQNEAVSESQESPNLGEIEIEPIPTFSQYLGTIFNLSDSLKWVCLTNFFSWMSLVCYSLYFTDFVGEAVYGGNPSSPLGSEDRKLYESGVRFGSLGMSLYSISCSIYSILIDHLILVYGARNVYIYGQLAYSCGMLGMGIFRHPVGVILLSITAGIMYATLFTMPYLLVARYHEYEFNMEGNGLVLSPEQLPKMKRGLGTDVAIVSSMVFLAQITQALTLGTVVNMTSITAIVFAASLFAFLSALSARNVSYLDL